MPGLYFSLASQEWIVRSCEENLHTQGNLEGSHWRCTLCHLHTSFYVDDIGNNFNSCVTSFVQIQTMSCMVLYSVSVISWLFAWNQFLHDSLSTPFPRKVKRRLQSMHITLCQEFCSRLPNLVPLRIFEKISTTNLPKLQPTKQPLLNCPIECTTFYYTQS